MPGILKGRFNPNDTAVDIREQVEENGVMRHCNVARVIKKNNGEMIVDTSSINEGKLPILSSFPTREIAKSVLKEIGGMGVEVKSIDPGQNRISILLKGSPEELRAFLAIYVKSEFVGEKVATVARERCRETMTS